MARRQQWCWQSVFGGSVTGSTFVYAASRVAGQNGRGRRTAFAAAGMTARPRKRRRGNGNGATVADVVDIGQCAGRRQKRTCPPTPMESRHHGKDLRHRCTGAKFAARQCFSCRISGFRRILHILRRIGNSFTCRPAAKPCRGSAKLDAGLGHPEHLTASMTDVANNQLAADIRRKLALVT
jgi:hypothetical protein